MERGCYDWLYEQSVTKFLLAAWKSGLMVVLAVGGVYHMGCEG